MRGTLPDYFVVKSVTSPGFPNVIFLKKLWINNFIHQRAELPGLLQASSFCNGLYIPDYLQRVILPPIYLPGTLNWGESESTLALGLI